MPQQAPGQSHREGPTLVQVIAKFGDEESAERRFTERLCPKSPTGRAGRDLQDLRSPGPDWRRRGPVPHGRESYVTYPDDSCVEWRHRDGLQGLTYD